MCRPNVADYTKDFGDFWLPDAPQSGVDLGVLDSGHVTYSGDEFTLQLFSTFLLDPAYSYATAVGLEVHVRTYNEVIGSTIQLWSSRTGSVVDAVAMSATVVSISETIWHANHDLLPGDTIMVWQAASPSDTPGTADYDFQSYVHTGAWALSVPITGVGDNDVVVSATNGTDWEKLAPLFDDSGWTAPVGTPIPGDDTDLYWLTQLPATDTEEIYARLRIALDPAGVTGHSVAGFAISAATLTLKSDREVLAAYLNGTALTLGTPVDNGPWQEYTIVLPAHDPAHPEIPDLLLFKVTPPYLNLVAVHARDNGNQPIGGSAYTGVISPDPRGDHAGLDIGLHVDGLTCQGGGRGWWRPF